jgi:hypothetical protein
VDGATEQRVQSFSNRLQAVLGIVGGIFPFWTTQVTHQDHATAAIQRRLDRRQGFGDASVVGNLQAIIQRDIEVATHQHGFTGNIDISNRLLGHDTFVFYSGVQSQSERDGESLHERPLADYARGRPLDCQARRQNGPVLADHSPRIKRTIPSFPRRRDDGCRSLDINRVAYAADVA